ncbi:carboxylating nicotinate-nucleotide diphosphorylase [Streptomyces sp. ISL-66]|uniref:carboxylating nicotinate-nucleotide diphosphorylase n=1 Tax=Streptomyces sp. ISL-66 TaxID=2819186 RepID=UPI001BED1C51|nr:carboxylating nicotinate-nucleotide diphosphorylase [Streptomyces sp. ISL-66]MBT2470440.1 carboxylating nicotinate-nucleotide diphosphorylase [Streptomyces sp. ISL-66]
MLELPVIRELVSRCLIEDLGRGDTTTDACVPPEAEGRAVMAAREDLVFCGGALVREVFAQLDPRVEVEQLCREGELLTAGKAAVALAGPAQSLLKGERLALNFAQRMSGVATLTRSFVDALTPGSATRITDTRKTTPGLRVVERYAVRCGGGYSHRSDLGAAVLIKDNHVAAAGGITAAVTRSRAAATHATRITCEVDTLEQLSEAIEAGVDIVILDNFTDEQIATAVEFTGGLAVIEVSGSVSRERIRDISALGVDVVSIGALTHSARAVDLGLDWTA